MSNRLHSLDALRGIMMLLGIVLHSAASFVVYPISELWPYKFQETNTFFDITLTFIHLFRIPIFYMIAGYFMNLQLAKYGMKRTIKKRFDRIAIPFILGMIFLAPIVTFGFYILLENIEILSWQTIVDYQQLYIFSTVHYWFLYYLLFFYGAHLIYWKLLKLKIENIAIAPKFVLIGFVALQILVLLVFGNDSIHGNYNLIPPIGSIIYFLNYYLLGIWLRNQMAYFTSLTRITFGRIVMIFVFFVSYLVFQDNESHLQPYQFWQTIESILTICTAFLLILLVFGVFQLLFNKPKKWVTYLAKASYTIYMIHLPILVMILYFIKDFFSNPIVLFSFLVLLTGFVSLVVYRMVHWLVGVRILDNN